MLGLLCGQDVHLRRQAGGRGAAGGGRGALAHHPQGQAHTHQHLQGPRRKCGQDPSVYKVIDLEFCTSLEDSNLFKDQN